MPFAPFRPSTMIRNAVANFVTSANLPNLVKVYAKPPFDVGNIPWDAITPPGSTTDAIGVVYIDSSEDKFTVLDGYGGRRIVTYQVSLELMSLDVSGDPDIAGDLMDNLIDGVKFRLITDPWLGTTPPGENADLIQAAVSKLYIERGRPVRPGNGDAWVEWCALHFAVETYEYST